METRIIGTQDYIKDLINQKYNQSDVKDIEAVSMVVTNDSLAAFNSKMYNAATYRANYLFYGNMVVSVKQVYDDVNKVGTELWFQQYKDDKLHSNNFENVFAIGDLNINGAFNGTPEYSQRWQNFDCSGIFFSNIVEFAPNSPNDKWTVQLNGYLIKV